jgi:hypothetical protein
MSLLAATTVAALLIANPSTTELDRIAADGGFLIGNAHRCGIEQQRVVNAGQVVRDLIVAAASDSKEQEDATGRFAAFFLVSAFPDEKKEKLVASCKLVAKEFADFEQHAKDTAIGGGEGTGFRLGDGE